MSVTQHNVWAGMQAEFEAAMAAASIEFRLMPFQAPALVTYGDTVTYELTDAADTEWLPHKDGGTWRMVFEDSGKVVFHRERFRGVPGATRIASSP